MSWTWRLWWRELWLSSVTNFYTDISRHFQMYTANTIASCAEILGMTLPGSSSFPAESPEKLAECAEVGSTMLNLLEKNLLPSHIMTRQSFENAMVPIPNPTA